jgi:transcriptional regulator with XRE-family HTH domain
MVEQKSFCFPTRLQQSRLQRGWKQATLADALGVKRRTVISWEAGERIPPVGVVVRLSTLLKTDLLTPYIADDLLRQYGQALPQEQSLLPNGLAALLQEPGVNEAEGSTQSLSGHEEPLEDNLTIQRSEDNSPSPDLAPAPAWHNLFALLDLLHTQPDLIRVTLDFLQEMTDDRDAQLAKRDR